MKRADFIKELQQYPLGKLVYIDESGIENSFQENMDGEQTGLKSFGRRYTRESFVAAQHQKKIIAPFCYKGTCDSTLFNFWLENFLLPALGPGYILIMANAAFHKSEQTKSLNENAGCKLLFLPPYSPDLNPIEKFWANLKAKIKRIIKNFSTLAEAVDEAFICDQLNHLNLYLFMELTNKRIDI